MQNLNGITLSESDTLQADMNCLVQYDHDLISGGAVQDENAGDNCRYDLQYPFFIMMKGHSDSPPQISYNHQRLRRRSDHPQDSPLYLRTVLSGHRPPIAESV